MNIFSRVTSQSLRKNKTRTVVTIIGIILSTALVCAVTISVSSFMDYAVRYFIKTNGSWHGQSTELDYENFSKIKNSDEISDCIAMKEIGYAETASENQYKPYLYIVSAEGNPDDDIIPINITQGEYPDSADEILIPDHLNKNGGVVYNIGDTIELEIGDRMLDGCKLHQNNPVYQENYDVNGNYSEEFSEEEFVPRETRTYTVSGFYERPTFEEYYAAGYTAIVLDDGFSEDTVYDVYFTMKNPKDIYAFMDENQLNGSTNYELLMLYGVSGYDSFYRLFYNMATILIVLIMFGSVSLIYNAFSISVSERTRQFGLLSSIGATRKQLRRMVFYEAFTVSVIGIPSGIIVGVAGIGITLAVIGNKISSVIGFDMPMKMCVSPLAIITACAVSVITVLLSAWIPSIRATRITAVEAIRQNKDIKSKNKPIKTPKIIYKVFGLSGMLAQKYFRRSRKKYRSTIMSLFMSIVLFISASAFCEYIISSINTPFRITEGADLRYYYGNNYSYENTDENRDKLLDIFSSDENITAVSYTKIFSTVGEVSKSYLTQEAIESYRTENSGDFVSKAFADIVFLDDNSFRELLRENNLDEEKFMNPENPLAVAIDGNTTFNYDEQRYVKNYTLNSDECEFTGYRNIDIDGYYFDGYLDNSDGHMFVYRNSEDAQDVKLLTREEATEKSCTIKSGKTITKIPYWWVYRGTNFSFVYPYSMIENVVHENLDGYSLIYYMTSDDHSKSYENISKKLDDNSFPLINLNDLSAENEKEHNIVTVIRVFAYGFIVLISLIAAANVFNTISTNINLRRRDFAMLKSIGMTEKELRRMMNYECLMYGTKSLIYGLPVSAGITFLIYKSMDIGIESDFFMPWKAVAIAVMSVFAVVFATMLYSISKTKSDNLIETLKNENI